MKRSDLILMIFMFALLDFGMAIIFNTQIGNRKIGQENRTYLHANACVISVSPTTRTPQYVKACYDQAEKETGVSVERYGNAK